MSNKSTTTQKPITHFEQVPLDVVKSIAREDAGKSEKTAADREAVKPASRKKVRAAAEHFHAVRFYDEPEALCRIVGTFIGEGLDQGAIAVLFVTPDHAARIESCLRTRGIDVDASKRLGRIVTFDAQATLDLLMVDAMPDPSAFRRIVGETLSHIRHGHGRCDIRAYGEMVDLLWKDGLEAAAIRLETLWNQLADTQDFNLLCAYSMGSFFKGTALDKIKALHTHLVADDGIASELTSLSPSGAPV